MCCTLFFPPHIDLLLLYKWLISVEGPMHGGDIVYATSKPVG